MAKNIRSEILESPYRANASSRAGLDRQTKIQLAREINHALNERKLSQAAAAELTGLTQPKISSITNYRLDGFSVERLMNVLNAVGRDIEIVVRRKPRSTPGIHVTAA